MPNIKPVSDLRNYTEVLRGISVGEPVFLTKNGRGKYVILDMEEYEKQRATLKLLSELSKAEKLLRRKAGFPKRKQMPQLIAYDETANQP